MISDDWLPPLYWRRLRESKDSCLAVSDDIDKVDGGKVANVRKKPNWPQEAP